MRAGTIVIVALGLLAVSCTPSGPARSLQLQGLPQPKPFAKPYQRDGWVSPSRPELGTIFFSVATFIDPRGRTIADVSAREFKGEPAPFNDAARNGQLLLSLVREFAPKNVCGDQGVQNITISRTRLTNVDTSRGPQFSHRALVACAA